MEKIEQKDEEIEKDIDSQAARGRTIIENWGLNKQIQEMINFDQITGVDTIKQNSEWPHVPDNLYRTLIICGSGLGKTLNLFNLQPDIDQIYLCVKDPYEDKCQYLIKKPLDVGRKHFQDRGVFIEVSTILMMSNKILTSATPRKTEKYQFF